MEQRYMVTEGLGRLMRKFSLPCVVSLLVAALYNIVDQIFIANAPDLGSYGNAANTVVFPLTVVALAVAVMIGDGACAMVSISQGAGALLTVFGGRVNGETFEKSREYFFWITVGIPVYMFGQAMNPIIRSDGSPRFAMASTLVGAGVNMVLDPLFIYVFHWGMTGAALATILGQALTAGLAAWYVTRMRTMRLTKGDFRPDIRVVGRFLALGMTSFLSQISLVAAMAANNNMIRVYSGLDPVFSQPQLSQIPMAVVGIVMKVFQIVISIVVGMAAGCIPVVGYNIGAGEKERVKKLFMLLLSWEAAVGGIALLIVELFPGQLIAIFGSANESPHYAAFAVRAFRIYLCMMPLACVNKATFIYLQSLGRAVASSALSMIREVVFGVGFVLLLPRFFGLDGVLYSMPASDLLTFIIAAALIYTTCRSLKTEQA